MAYRYTSRGVGDGRDRLFLLQPHPYSMGALLTLFVLLWIRRSEGGAVPIVILLAALCVVQWGLPRHFLVDTERVPCVQRVLWRLSHATTDDRDDDDDHEPRSCCKGAR